MSEHFGCENTIIKKEILFGGDGALERFKRRSREMAKREIGGAIFESAIKQGGFVTVDLAHKTEKDGMRREIVDWYDVKIEPGRVVKYKTPKAFRVPRIEYVQVPAPTITQRLAAFWQEMTSPVVYDGPKG